MKNWVTVIILLISFPAFSSLFDIKDNIGFEKTACKTVEECASQMPEGNNLAKTSLGLFHIEGKDAKGKKVRKNIIKGISMLKEAAKDEDPLAQAILGTIYYDGIIVKKDFIYAAEMFLRSAIHGAAYSQHRIGMMYLNGEGVKKHELLAVYWLKQAAARDDFNAMTELGTLYIEGRGVKKDIKRGQAWMQRSYEKKNK